MDLTLLQIFVIFFVVFTVSRAVLRLRDSEITVGEFIFWIIIWALVSIAAFFPSMLIRASDLFGVGRGVDLMVYVSVPLLFYLIFRTYVKIEKLEQEITFLVREIALQNPKRKKKK